MGANLEDSNAIGINGNQNDNSENGAGAVYVFTRSGTTWSQQAYIKASNTGANDEFGWSVALAADGNTLAVGAYQEDSNATGVNGNQNNNSASRAGAVYVFGDSSADLAVNKVLRIQPLLTSQDKRWTTASPSPTTAPMPPAMW